MTFIPTPTMSGFVRDKRYQVTRENRFREDMNNSSGAWIIFNGTKFLLLFQYGEGTLVSGHRQVNLRSQYFYLFLNIFEVHDSLIRTLKLKIKLKEIDHNKSYLKSPQNATKSIQKSDAYSTFCRVIGETFNYSLNAFANQNSRGDKNAFKYHFIG